MLPLRGRLRVRPLLAIGVFAVGVPLVLGGCGSDKVAVPSSVASATGADGTFTMNEFTIKLGSQSLLSGTVLLTANNVGSEEHELVVRRGFGYGGVECGASAPDGVDDLFGAAMPDEGVGVVVPV